MYIRVKERKLIKELDSNLKIPRKFYSFIEKIEHKKHRLILKKSNEYYCTNCNHTFKLKINKKIHQECRCPACKNKYMIKSARLKNFFWKDYIAILDRYNDYWIIRMFELKTVYINGKYNSMYCEYARRVYNSSMDIILEIVNNNFLNYLGGISIVHKSCFDSNWRKYYSYYNLGYYFIYYPYNLKKIFNNTKFQYSQLWALSKKVEYFDIIYLLKNYRQSIEYLIKLKLYNLALNPRTFSKKGTFKEIFGVDKSFLKFMQRNNITFDELIVLRYYQKKKINVIRAFQHINLDEIIKYNIDLDKLLKKTDFSTLNYIEYYDYLRFANQLNYDMKNNDVLYPKNIIIEHNKLQNLIKIKKDKKINNLINKRYHNLLKYSFKNNNFIVVPAKSLNSLIDESNQMNNCVKTYAESYAKGDCDIYFLRKIESPDKSLVTIEVKNNLVVQKRTKNNRETNSDQNRFIKYWQKNILNLKEKV